MKFHQPSISKLAVAAALIASIAVPAAADNNITPGVACRNYNAGDAEQMDYLSSGVRSDKNGSTQVICPVTQAGPGDFAKDHTVVVRMGHNGTQTTSCTAFLHDASGLLKRTVSGSVTRSGVAFINLRMSGSGVSQGLAQDSVTVLCTIAGNRATVLRSVQLSTNYDS